MALEGLKARVPKPILRAVASLVTPAQYLIEYSKDARRYAKHSSGRDGVVTGRSSREQFEAQLTKDYHRVEKGLALPAPRRPFGAKVEDRLKDLLSASTEKRVDDEPYVHYARTALDALESWNSGGEPRDVISPIVDLDPRLTSDQLSRFFSTRRSVRNFVPIDGLSELIGVAAEHATNTPSVCNRQPGRLHFYSGSGDVRRVLALQNGNAGYGDTVPAVVVVSVDTRLSTGVSERQQRYIDGGLFAMSFVWALHGLGVASCMLNWSMNNSQSDRLRQVAGIPPHEDIIMMIAVGGAASEARVARSPRRAVENVLTEHNVDNSAPDANAAITGTVKRRLRNSAEKLAKRCLHTARRVIDRPSVLVKRAAVMRSKVAAVEPAVDASRHILLTSTGNRNIGDQAMFESFLENVEGPIDAIVLSSASYVVPDEAKGRVRLHQFDSLIYGRGSSQLADVERFVALLTDARSFSVVGADIIDGGYQQRAPLMSWALATGAANAGVDARVLGFSWGENVSDSILHAARGASESGVKLYARDPDSADRLRRAGVQAVASVVDSVFALQGSDEATPEFRKTELLKDTGRRFALLNVSGLIAGRMNVVDDYVKVAEALISRGLEVVALPHVDNRGGSDTAAIREFVAHASARGVSVTVVDRLLAPKQVRAMASLADIVVTGRMHLSILSLSVGTPAIVLATQGKVSGLMSRVAHPEWCIVPQPGMAANIIAQLDDALALDRATLNALLPDLSKTARLNFEGLNSSPVT